MSQPGLPLPVKPIVSLLLARQDLRPVVMDHLTGHFGPPDLVGPWWPFIATDYYTPVWAPAWGVSWCLSSIWPIRPNWQTGRSLPTISKRDSAWGAAGWSTWTPAM